MDSLPRRLSLPDQVTQLLRDGIRAGRWHATLPSEVELVREFKVSRVTLRKALNQLTHEHWIGSAGRGRHHPILQAATSSTSPVRRVIRLLSRNPIEATASVTQVSWNKLREELSSAGYHLKHETHPELFRHPRLQDLEKLLAYDDTCAWILYRVPAAIQVWFSQQDIVCVTAGSVHADANLANVEFDFASLSRHAAGLFYQRGHRHLAFLCPEPLSVSDEVSMHFFVEEARRLGADACVLSFNSELSSLRRALATALASRPQPTAYFCAWPEHALTTLTYLQQAKLRVPQDAAIICRINDTHLDYTVPTISHYRLDGARYGHKAAQLLIDMIKHGHGKREHVKITPHFVAGESLG